MKTISSVHHEYVHFEDLQHSSQEFYSDVDQLLKEQQFPGVSSSRIVFSEGGVMSGNREYLWIKRNKHNFYVCAAPFGKHFLVSWWLRTELGIWGTLVGHIPFIGKYLVAYTDKKTFYQIDTELIFLEGVKSVVNQVIATLSESRGRRQ